jgi:hypothetical protein
MLGGAIGKCYIDRHGELKVSGTGADGLSQSDASLALQKANEFNARWNEEKSTYEALFEHKDVDTISAKARA